MNHTNSDIYNNLVNMLNQPISNEKRSRILQKLTELNDIQPNPPATFNRIGMLSNRKKDMSELEHPSTNYSSTIKYEPSMYTSGRAESVRVPARAESMRTPARAESLRIPVIDIDWPSNSRIMPNPNFNSNKFYDEAKDETKDDANGIDNILDDMGFDSDEENIDLDTKLNKINILYKKIKSDRLRHKLNNKLSSN